MKITIKTIPHDKQRYETCGDWGFDQNGDLDICVSAMGDWRYELLVGVHELIEAALCKHRGIAGEAVDAFDKDFGGDGEPGDDPRAPYHKEHRSATNVEMRLAAELGVDWIAYDDAVLAL